MLKNLNVEYCESAGGPGTAGDIYEVTQDSNAQTVWKMLVTGQFVYRGQRIPSLYPGVQWRAKQVRAAGKLDAWPSNNAAPQHWQCQRVTGAGDISPSPLASVSISIIGWR